MINSFLLYRLFKILPFYAFNQYLYQNSQKISYELCRLKFTNKFTTCIKNNTIRNRLLICLQVHIPVLLNEVLIAINPCDGMLILDCTFGRGGHTRSFLEKGARVIAVDRDEAAICYGKSNFQKYIQSGQLQLIHSKFSSIYDVLSHNVDAVLCDFGISSPQIDDNTYGFSYMQDSPLNMCMGLNKISAFDVVNNFSEAEIDCIISELGEERYSKKIARQIVLDRKEQEMRTTFQLRNSISKVIFDRFLIKSCARVFQALRMYVNDEIGELKSFFSHVSDVIHCGGVLSCISFHSLEDRIVKRFFQYGKNSISSDNLITKERYYECDIDSDSNFFEKHTRIFPSDEEIRQNPRSRSAILRFARKKS